jgi:hypothetical protein
MMSTVKALGYHSSGARAGRDIAYILHREERLPGGRSRDIHGLGIEFQRVIRDLPDPRAREVAALELMRDHARRTASPVWHRHVFTVDNTLAEALSKLDRAAAEARLVDAFLKTLRSARRDLQGVYAIHWHGGRDRPWGNPHIHAVYSPRLRNGGAVYIGKQDLEKLKRAWTLELTRSLERSLSPSLTREGRRIGEGVQEPTLAMTGRHQGEPERTLGISPARVLGAVNQAKALVHNPAGTLARTGVRLVLRETLRTIESALERGDLSALTRGGQNPGQLAFDFGMPATDRQRPPVKSLRVAAAAIEGLASSREPDLVRAGIRIALDRLPVPQGIKLVARMVERSITEG